MTRVNQATSSGQNDSIYLLNLGRTQAPDFTPYSAQSTVSSFNLPVQYDSSLITPVSMTSSPSMATKSTPLTKREPDVKLSPGGMSPSYQLFCADEDYSSRYNPPMKHKEPSGALHISATDTFFPPGSPFVCASPYYGNFGVSATPHSAKTSSSSPSFHHSPNMQSAGGYSSGSFHSRNQTPALSATSYRSSNPTPIHIAPSPSSPPILIAPSPSILRPATNQEGGLRRQSSLQSNHSTPKGPFTAFSQDGPPSSSKGKKGLKRKESPGLWEEILERGSDLTESEMYLLQMSVRDNIPWKEIAEKHSALTGKEVKQATLQMRKKRLIDKLRERALILSVEESEKTKWSTVAKGMQKHGAKERWSTEAVEKKWHEMQTSGYTSHFDLGSHRRHRTSSSDLSHLAMDQRSWSDGGESVVNSLDDENSGMISALSTATMDDVRSRTGSDASVQMQIQQQHHRQVQQQMIYDQQNQRQHQQQHQQREQQRDNSWTSGA